MGSFEYPNVEAVSNVIGQVHEIVAGWGLIGRWVTTQVAGGVYVTTEEMRVVCATFLPLIVRNAQSLTIETIS